MAVRGAPAIPKVPRWAWVPILLWAALCIGTLFAIAMVREVTYDEDQYIAAGVMAQHALPYRDFLYLQAPLYPFVVAPVFKLVGGWYLLTGRVVTFVLAVLSGAFLWATLRRLGGGAGLVVLLMTACLLSPFLASPLVNTRNDVLPLMLLLAGLWAHVRWRDESFWGQVLAALLMGLAAEAKVTSVFAPAVLLLHALGAPRRQVGQRLGPVLLGVGVAALPAGICFALAPDAFVFGLAGFHLAAPAEWYTSAGMADVLRPATKLRILGGWAVLGGSLSLLLLTVVLGLVAMRRRGRWAAPGPLLLALVLGALLLGFIPSPSWAMYYAALPPLLACCVVHLYGRAAPGMHPRWRVVLIAASVVPLVQPAALLGQEIPPVLDRANWVGMEAHRTALAIRAALPAGATGDIATLFPLGVVDANPIRPAFATGPFVFRSGTLWRPAFLTRLHALSAPMLEEAFARQPPAAIYAGIYPRVWKEPMDAALSAYATDHGWRAAWQDGAGGTLYLPP